MSAEGLFRDLNEEQVETIRDTVKGKKPWTAKRIKPGESFTVESSDDRLQNYVEYAISEEGTSGSKLFIKGPVTILVIPDEDQN